MNALYLLIPTFLILLFLTPVIVQIKATFNIQSKQGVLAIFIFGVKILYYMYEIKGKTIVLKNQKETKETQLSLENNDLLFIEFLVGQIKDKTRLKQLYVFYNLGAGDAFLTAMLGGFLNIAVLTFFTSLKSKKPTASLGIYDTISYNKTLFEIALKSKISISLIDIAYSLLNSVILTWKAKAKLKHNIQQVVCIA